jgi:hypothetical protein
MPEDLRFWQNLAHIPDALPSMEGRKETVTKNTFETVKRSGLYQWYCNVYSQASLWEPLYVISEEEYTLQDFHDSFKNIEFEKSWFYERTIGTTTAGGKSSREECLQTIHCLRTKVKFYFYF